MHWLRPHTRAMGNAAERHAEKHLCTQGLRSIARNFHAPGGEIDLIMRDGETLVFIEVRFRQDNSRGNALETVTTQKQARIRKAASYFLQQHPDMAEYPCRFDVVGIEPDVSDKRVTLHWIQDAFT